MKIFVDAKKLLKTTLLRIYYYPCNPRKRQFAALLLPGYSLHWYSAPAALFPQKEVAGTQKGAIPVKNCLIRIPVGGLRRAALWAGLGMACFASAPALAQSGRAAGPTMCACPGAHKPLGNNATCEIACYGSSSGAGSSNNDGAYEAGRAARRWFDCNVFGKGCNQTDNRPSPGHGLNEQGVQAYNKGDWATAVSYFERALQQEPNDPVIRKNLDNARAAMEQQQARERQEKEAMDRQRQNKAAADNMQQSIQNFAQTLNAAPVSGGLDFDGSTAGAAPGNSGKSGGLDFTATVATPGKAVPAVPAGDPKVVDVRKAPSGLPKDVENAIAGAYQNAPPGVGDRVRKGFQAVMDRDWKAAKAWFEDALNRDPDNVGLKRFVALAGHTPERDRQAAPSTAAPVSEPRRPSPDDVYYYVPSRGYDRMSLEDTTLRQVWDETLGIPPGSIVNIR